VRAQSAHTSAWASGPIRVISELAEAESPVCKGQTVPQWHLSITTKGNRPKPHHVRRALRAFGMTGAEEDNHYPGAARYFWLPVYPAHRADCECKETEVTVVDADGYRWQNPRDEGECRGCEYEAIFGRVCPLHGASVEKQAEVRGE
jgi:hypothetical protein